MFAQLFDVWYQMASLLLNVECFLLQSFFIPPPPCDMCLYNTATYYYQILCLLTGKVKSGLKYVVLFIFVFTFCTRKKMQFKFFFDMVLTPTLIYTNETDIFTGHNGLRSAKIKLRHSCILIL